MATYKSKTVSIPRPVADVFHRFDDLSVLNEKIAQIPAEKLAQIGQIKLEKDSVAFINPAIGTIKLEITERIEPSTVKFQAASSPIPMSLTLCLAPASDTQTDAQTNLDVDVPAMLKPLIGGKLQEAADKFGELLTMLG